MAHAAAGFFYGAGAVIADLVGKPGGNMVSIQLLPLLLLYD